MPHSSGGGHHGGGSHRSHHSSRRSGSVSRGPTTSHTYFAGARRYRYRRWGRTRYVYCSDDPSSRFHPASLFMLIVYLPFMIFGLWAISKAGAMPKYTDHDIVICDEAGVLGSTQHLEASLKAFHDKTDITPAVVSVGYDKWSGDLEKYAYDRYLDMFGDEMHWLIVLSVNDDRSDWCFEGMQGDNTDPVLTAGITAEFNRELYNKLESKGVKDAGATIASEFDEILPKLKKPGISDKLKGSVPIIGMLLFLVFHAYFMLGLNNIKYRNAVEEPDTGGQEIMYTPEVKNGEGIIKRELISEPQQSGIKICPSCGMTCGAAEKNCPVCGEKV